MTVDDITSPPPPTPETQPRPGMPPRALDLAEQPVKPTFSPVVVSGLVRITEAAVLVVSGFTARLVLGSEHSDGLWPEAALILLVGIVAVLLFEAAQLYSIPMFRQRFQQITRVVAAWTGLMLAVLAGLFLLGWGAPILPWLLGWWSLAVVVLATERFGLALLVKHWTRAGRLLRRTVIVGGGLPGEDVVRRIKADTKTDVELCGVFDDRTDERSPDMVAGVPKLGTVDDLVEFARRTRIDLVIFSLPISAEGRILQMLRKLQVLPVDIRLAAHTNKLQFRPRSYSYVGSVPVIDIFDKPIAHWDVVLKWLFDRLVGAAMLVVLAPVMAGVALAIKMDSKGPVLFRQKRYGFNNELIEVFKFRSMYTDMTDATATKLVTKDDPRVTKVGRFIRKTSLDELPQLFNVVLKGDLSLVGPRPHAVHAKAQNQLYDQVVDGYFARHRVKPGITGWAQINGWRGETDTEEKIQQRVSHDLFYIENWSVMLDLRILAMTPISLLRTENAY
ncbi:undecaprenyl-phosphate glucose phosphotransferase [Terrihabitans rhizophilus]|uniref:Undecaprenyl-phosphate glucose phosphotransferase n=1 Tax=Terrihabitans rhizophilus TaxID=3092662 RepID=A0ABU4RW37_9HYPH|nr:undecaprenyl-phosphate glucose phosphotransferase [Terrihabitans sp. PJ23]MDX6807091.1 undecaprenyl-phosphate glucose phosphotransferase [Terrihabitans sp. PJ23]